MPMKKSSTRIFTQTITALNSADSLMPQTRTIVIKATIPSASKLKTDRKSTRLNSSHSQISYAVFCLKKKKQHNEFTRETWHICCRSRAPAHRVLLSDAKRRELMDTQPPCDDTH